MVIYHILDRFHGSFFIDAFVQILEETIVDTDKTLGVPLLVMSSSSRLNASHVLVLIIGWVSFEMRSFNCFGFDEKAFSLL
jgi:hypothetical protein